ncbi:EpsG family protein [Bacillus sp. ISL-35]|uniref:EpsG family protein n=1 Tax=Bacillus sp. ISL-35 TaxID=2819122 RepID=UPI001BE8F09D|nr:EpsG family protein [Bacillus sp. ISL-35]MBT2678820.1 EpsG family protein [Bacillus sp. ISL-35]MBT2703812.1 EpsG family protein [Chryseobacterium sp. ISL-80]
MGFLFVISVTYLCFYFTKLIVGTMYEIKSSKIFDFSLSLLVVISIVIISISIKPDIEYDLSRHYEIVNNMRYYGYEYETGYESLVIIKVIFYLVSLSRYNELLPAISVAITYSIFIYITRNFINKYKTSNKLFLLSWLINISILPFLVSYSGVRTSMAFAIFALALYRDIILKKKNLTIIILYVIPLFIHPASGILVGLRILYFNRNLFVSKLKYLLLFWSFSSYILIDLLESISIPYISYTAQKLQIYFLKFDGDHRLYFVNMCFFIFLFILFRWINLGKKADWSENINKLMEYIELVILFAIGSFYIPSITERLLYFIAFFAFPIIYLSVNNSRTRLKLMVIIIFSLFIVGYITYQYIQVSSHNIYISFDFLRMN